MSQIGTPYAAKTKEQTHQDIINYVRLFKAYKELIQGATNEPPTFMKVSTSPRGEQTTKKKGMVKQATSFLLEEEQYAISEEESSSVISKSEKEPASFLDRVEQLSKRPYAPEAPSAAVPPLMVRTKQWAKATNQDIINQIIARSKISKVAL